LQHEYKLLKINVMARPIKDTPLLSKKEWERLEYEMTHVKPVPAEKREAMKKSYEWSKSIATFPML
jgi:hypothetical protein